MTAKTNAQKQADYRARLAAKGLTEIRGLHAPPVEHEARKIEFKAALKKPVKKIQEQKP